jgi:hypothetical protein
VRGQLDEYTEEQHERAVSLLSERDEIQCVITDFEEGLVVVHTPYVTSDVVKDFCLHFGYEIVRFGPAWEKESILPCMSDHGSTFEIALSYTMKSDSPIPLNVEFVSEHIDELDENDKQF